MTNSMFTSCIQACSNCALVCETCASACLREDDVKMMARCVELDRDCADICTLAAPRSAALAERNAQNIKWITAKTAPRRA